MLGQLLILGDLHLGRRPQQVPEGMEPRSLGPEVGWRRSVAYALKERVSALLLAGDVIEGLNDRFEAERILRPGIDALQAAGIPVIAVLGNHDVYALPRLAASIAGLSILGPKGWEAREIIGPDGPICQLLGRSFAAVVERENPLAGIESLALNSQLATIGLLHCDLDTVDSRYAPVASQDFHRGAAAGVDAFFLGHIHKPSALELAQERPCGYLGSVVGLSPKETGAHGPWLVTVMGPGRVQARQVALAPIRFETLTLDLNGSELTAIADLEDDLQRRCQALMMAIKKDLGAAADPLSALVIRLRLLGRVSRPDLVHQALNRLLANNALVVEEAELTISCNSYLSALLPSVPWAELERSNGAVGGLVRRWLSSSGLPAQESEALREELRLLLAKKCWHDLEPLVDFDLEALVQEAGRELLSSLLLAAVDSP